MLNFIAALLSSVIRGGNVRNKPLLQQDLLDHATQGYVDKSFRFTFGKNTNVDNVNVDLWEGPTGKYVPPASAIAMQVVSTSANDTAGGTGAQKLRIDVLDEDYNLSIIEVIPNGTTPVSVPGTILRINYMHVSEAGSAGNSVGDISITNVGGTVTYGIIKAGYNTCRQAFGTVPA